VAGQLHRRGAGAKPDSRIRSGELVLRFGAAWSLAGVARDPEGRPLADARLFRRSAGEGWVHAGRTDGDGRFRLELPAGPVALRIGSVETPPPDSPAQRVVAEGVDGGPLVFETGATIRVRVSDRPHLHRCACLLTAERGEGPAHPSWIRAEGTVRFVGLDPSATYTLYAHDFVHERCIYLTGLRPRDEVVRTDPVPDRPVTGRVRLPEGYRPEFPDDLTVTVRGRGFSCRSEVARDGTFRVTGVPEGRWSLAISFQALGADWAAEMEVAAGSEVEVLPRRKE
jgi:hypothetical protein